LWYSIKILHDLKKSRGIQYHYNFEGLFKKLDFVGLFKKNLT